MPSGCPMTWSRMPWASGGLGSVCRGEEIGRGCTHAGLRRLCAEVCPSPHSQVDSAEVPLAERVASVIRIHGPFFLVGLCSF